LLKALPEGRTVSNTIAYPPADKVAAANYTILATRAELYARRVWDGGLGVFIGYGYAARRALGWLAGAWLLGVYIFLAAYAQGAMKPNNPFILRSPEWAYCGSPPHRVAPFARRPSR
jgi:hypothetical protein